MKNSLLKLAKRLRTELDDLEQVVSRCERALRQSKLTSDDLYFDSMALNVQGFYSGLERLFHLIASTIDGKVPRGEEWHKELLQQMRSQVSGLRPAVLSESTVKMLDEYRRIRHVVRVIYTHQLEHERLEELTNNLRPTHTAVRRELLAFADFLEHHAREESK
jgi:hypothetical protein